LMLLRRWMQGVSPVFPNHKKRAEAGIVVCLPLWLFVCFLPGFLCISCGDPNDLSEDISDTPPEELILTQATHPDGWGLSECIFCHPLFKIHVKTSDPRVDLEKIHEVVDRLGQDSCVFCHGQNGT
jgi:hypothetical protein